MGPLFLKNFKRNCIKKWQRITASKTTKFAIILAIVQTIFIVAFQMKLLTRNVNLQLTPNPYTKEFQNTNHECYDELITAGFTGIPTEFLAGNNVIFIVFHLWQLYLFFNAVFHEHSIQIATICLFDFGWFFFGLVQGLEIKFPLNQLHSIKECEGKTDFDPSFWTNDIPFLGTLLVFTAISTWFSLVLYKQFGWNMYKKIGGDVKMRDAYKKYLIFMIFLKMNIFTILLYVFSFVVPYMHFGNYVYHNFKQESTVLTIIHLTASVLNFVIVILAYKSVHSEWKPGMMVFSILWIYIIIAVVIDLITNITHTVENFDYDYTQWDFLILVVIPSTLFWIGIYVGTYIYGILVFRNFGIGLKDLLSKSNDTDDLDKLNTNNFINLDMRRPSTHTKFVIDD
ncbi:hypothetical protein C2G38_2142367 [Gigaspora rosea]|uniref:Transmembrane protein n=1 Tax=Gigaspora rosea TaxID=44941 RepID=A0A397V5S0_9GLOM|nr:hypothetical protein C2G38_2142367 [Gigaspora rosea]